MKRIGYIYKLTAPNGKVYIGQTDNLRRRHTDYASGRCRGQKLLYNSIQKYGWDAHRVEVLFEGPASDKHLNLLETEYVRIHKSNRNRYPEEGGLNLTDGGGGVRGHKASPETKAKISAALRGRRKPPRSAEYRANIGAASRGRKHSTDSKAKRSAAQRGRKQSSETIAKKQKPVSQFTKEGIWIRDWNSVTEAGEVLGIRRGNISNCLIGISKSAGGYVWKYN